MNDIEKLVKAIHTLKDNTQFTFSSNEVTEETYNTIKWTTGEDNGTAITTTVNPHSEITWPLVKAEMDKL